MKTTLQHFFWLVSLPRVFLQDYYCYRVERSARANIWRGPHALRQEPYLIEHLPQVDQ